MYFHKQKAGEALGFAFEFGTFRAKKLKSQKFGNGPLIIAFPGSALFLYSMVIFSTRKWHGGCLWAPNRENTELTLMQTTSIIMAAKLFFFLKKRQVSKSRKTLKRRSFGSAQGTNKVLADYYMDTRNGQWISSHFLQQYLVHENVLEHKKYIDSEKTKRKA